MGYKIKYLELYPYGMKAVFAVSTAGEVQFELPATFDIASVKPLISNNVDIAYFQTRLLDRPHYIPPELQEIYRNITEKQQQMNLLAAKVALLNEEGTLFTIMPERIGIDAAAYIRDVQKIKLENKDEAARLAAQYEALSKELDILNSDYHRRLPQNVNQVIEVRTGIRSGELLVEAFCRYAGWTPSYRFNLNSETGNIEATFLAEVKQHSGLSFMGEIRLFTQNPSTAVQLPKLYTWPLDFRPEPVHRAVSESASPHAMRKQVLNQIDFEEAECMEMMDVTPAPVMTESLVNMSISTTAKVDGDGTPVSMDLKKFTVPSRHKVVISRSCGREGWLVCSVEDMPEPILPGTVSLYVDGQPSGNTAIEYTGRNEKTEISFGQMPLIKVKKDTDTAVSGTKSSFLSASGSIEDGYQLEVSNGSNIETDIELLDRVPFPVNDKITVEMITVEPAADENKENVLKWKMHLKPGEKKRFTVKYRIKYPADRKLNY